MPLSLSEKSKGFCQAAILIQLYLMVARWHGDGALPQARGSQAQIPAGTRYKC